MATSLKANSYLRNLSTTGFGVIVTTVISVLTTPLLSRLFTPEAYGIAGFYSQSIAYLGLLIGLMLPSALVVVRRSGVLYRLISAIKTLWIIGLVAVGAICFLLGGFIQEVLNDTSDGRWLLLLPLGLFSGQIFEFATSLNVRAADFKTNVKLNISSSILVRGFTLLGGWWFAGNYLALVIPTLLKVIPVWFFQHRKNLAKAWHIPPSLEYLRSTLRDLKEYPRYILSANLLGLAAQSAPFFILTILQTPRLAGLYLFAESMLLIPIRLVHKAVTPVYLQEISVSYHEAADEFRRRSRQTNHLLFLVGVVPYAVVAIFGAEIFSWVFGQDWFDSGLMAQYLAVFALFRLCTSPLSAIYRVAEKEHYALRSQIVLFLLRCLPLAFGLYFLPLLDALLCFALGSMLGYWFHFYQVSRIGAFPFARILLKQIMLFILFCGVLWLLKDIYT